MTNDAVDQTPEATNVVPLAVTPPPTMYGLRIDPVLVSVSEIAMILNVMQIQIPEDLYSQLPERLQVNFQKVN